MLAHPLAVLGKQSHRRRTGAKQPTLILRLESTVFQRRSALYATDTHHHPHGVGDYLLPRVLAVRPALPEWSDRRHHHAGIDFRNVLVSQAKIGQISRAVTLDYQVYVGDQLPQNAPASVRFEVECGALLVEVQNQEKEAFFGIGVVVVIRTNPPHRRPARRLNLEYVGAIVRQQPRAE